MRKCTQSCPWEKVILYMVFRANEIRVLGLYVRGSSPVFGGRLCMRSMPSICAHQNRLNSPTCDVMDRWWEKKAVDLGRAALMPTITAASCNYKMPMPSLKATMKTNTPLKPQPQKIKVLGISVIGISSVACALDTKLWVLKIRLLVRIGLTIVP